MFVNVSVTIDTLYPLTCTSQGRIPVLMSTLETQKPSLEDPLEFIRIVVESADSNDARQASNFLASIEPAESLRAAYHFAANFYTSNRQIRDGNTMVFGTRNKTNQAIDVTYGESGNSLFVGTHLKTPLGWEDLRDRGEESSYLFTLSPEGLRTRRLFIDGTKWSENAPIEIGVGKLEQAAALNAFFLSTVHAGIASAARSREGNVAANNNAKELMKRLITRNRNLGIEPFWVTAELVQVNSPRQHFGL